MTGHLSDTALERYGLGMIHEGPELDALEEHLLICRECVDRAWPAMLILTRFGPRWSKVALVRDRCVAAEPHGHQQKTEWVEHSSAYSKPIIATAEPQ